MKYILLMILTAISTIVLGQAKSINLNAIQSVEDAENLIKSYPSLDASIAYLTSKQATSVLEKSLLTKKKGDTITTVGYVYKVLNDTVKRTFRVSYIYIDGSKYTFQQVDSIRGIILSKYKSGTTFEVLAKEYNMDGNPNNGDTGDFGEKMMMKEFEDAVKGHKKNDIFKVDIPSNNWFYVVKKTHDDREIKEITILKLKSSS